MPQFNQTYGGGLLLGMGGQAASSIVGTGMGLLLQDQQDRRQLRQQRRLQGLEMEGQRQMTDYNLEKQYELWQRTSYPSQVEQLKKAGLNPAMIYGMGGAGGSTADIKTGNVTGAHAPMGGGEIGMGIQLGMDARLKQAQIDNINADTKLKEVNVPKTEAETDSIRVNIDKAKAETKNTETLTALNQVNKELAELQVQLQGKTIDEQERILEETVKRLQTQNQILLNDKEISDKTKDNLIKTVHYKMLEASLQNALTSAETTNVRQQTAESQSRVQVNQSQIQKITTEIAHMLNDIGLGWAKLSLEQRKTAIIERVGKFNSAGSQRWFDNILRAIQTVIPFAGKTGSGNTGGPIGFQIPIGGF